MKAFYKVHKMSRELKKQTDLKKQNVMCCLECFKQTVQRSKRQILCFKSTGDIHSQ